VGLFYFQRVTRNPDRDCSVTPRETRLNGVTVLHGWKRALVTIVERSSKPLALLSSRALSLPAATGRARRGLGHVSGGVKRWHVDTGGPQCSVNPGFKVLCHECNEKSGAPVFDNQDAIAQRSSPWAWTGTGRCREVPRVKRRKRYNGFLAIKR
jgi:hypothetical protein